MNERGEVREKRRYQRLELKVDVIVRTDSAMLPGRTQDISECGMSAILPVELREGQEVELQIRLPSATQTIRAIVRHRNVFRHGFEFVEPLKRNCQKRSRHRDTSTRQAPFRVPSDNGLSQYFDDLQPGLSGSQIGNGTFGLQPLCGVIP